MASPSRDQPQAHPSETLRFIERSHESELTRVGRLAHVGRNFPLAYLSVGSPGLLANVPTSRREHHNMRSSFRLQVRSFPASLSVIDWGAQGTRRLNAGFSTRLSCLRRAPERRPGN